MMLSLVVLIELFNVHSIGESQQHHHHYTASARAATNFKEC